MLSKRFWVEHKHTTVFVSLVLRLVQLVSSSVALPAKLVKGTFKYYISKFFKILDPQPPKR